MTDLPVEEVEAMVLAWRANSFTGITYKHDERGWFNTGYRAAREYSKQREEKLREEAIRLASLLHYATHDSNFTLENCARLECRNRRAALAENGDSDG